MTKNSLRIGISTRQVKYEKYAEKRDIISHDWINFFNDLNFIPVLIPNVLNDVTSFLDSMNLDGIILSGGDNIGDFPERDQTENKIIEFSIKKNIPLIGVCRGMQMINSFFGGTIKKNATTDHVGNKHEILFLKNTFCDIHKNSIDVNSFHNNLINSDNLGNDLESIAITSSDDSIEAFSHKKYSISGIMWHPERVSDENNKNIIRNFFKLV